MDLKETPAKAARKKTPLQSLCPTSGHWIKRLKLKGVVLAFCHSRLAVLPLRQVQVKNNGVFVLKDLSWPQVEVVVPHQLVTFQETFGEQSSFRTKPHFCIQLQAQVFTPSPFAPAPLPPAWKGSEDVAAQIEFAACRQAAEAILVRNWQVDDKIFLIGFSRGTYAIRAVAEMLHTLGPLRNDLRTLK